MTQLPTGLTAAEVAKKTQEGLHNDYETKPVNQLLRSSKTIY